MVKALDEITYRNFCSRIEYSGIPVVGNCENIVGFLIQPRRNG